MKIAVLSDIHGNLQALSACEKFKIHRRGAEARRQRRGNPSVSIEFLCDSSASLRLCGRFSSVLSQTLSACLAHAAREGADGHVFLGDLVGYGADPVACLDLLASHADKGALLVRGNHDQAALGGLCENMNFVAREATYWTRTQLGQAERDFLASLPLAAHRDDLFFVHASASSRVAAEAPCSVTVARASQAVGADATNC